jgi:uncharacterized protein
MPALALLGPRQVGKTTLVKTIESRFQRQSIYLDLESLEDMNRLQNAELYFLERQNQLVIIDEIQRMPQLFSLLRSLIDKNRVAGRFILLGSASPELLIKSSESLAGRISYIELSPVFFEEIKYTIPYQTHWWRGGFPNILLANTDKTAFRRLNDFVMSYVERELPILGLGAAPFVIKNLLTILVGVHGNLLNVNDLCRSMGLTSPTINRYLDFLESAFLIRRLQPFFINISKRIVKAPKFYFRDSGLFHSLAAIGSPEALLGSQYVGSSWEGYVIQQIIANLPHHIKPFFYRTADGTELDLVLVRGAIPILGFEIKYSNTPKPTRGNLIAQQDLGDVPIVIITPSADDFKIADKIWVCSLKTLRQTVDSIATL